MVLVRTTVGTKADADAMARRLVSQDDAVCCHVAAVESTFYWQGAMKSETEFLVEARAGFWSVNRLRRAMREGHPYGIPLIESMVTQANGEYRTWAARPPQQR
jgi:uncharacterized protein involved in tolerance to divalent cations